MTNGSRCQASTVAVASRREAARSSSNRIRPLLSIVGARSPWPAAELTKASAAGG
ncbi:MAG: hypothetical protein ABI689_12250 [Thermoanaerobaculia bacterium]